MKEMISSDISRFMQFEDLIKDINNQEKFNLNNEDYKTVNFTEFENLYKYNTINNKEITNETALNDYLNVKLNLKNISNALFFGEWKSNKFIKDLNNDKGKLIFKLDLQRYLTFSKEYYYEFFWQIELIRDEFYKDKSNEIKNVNDFFQDFSKIIQNLPNTNKINQMNTINEKSEISDIDIDFEKNIFTQINNYMSNDQQIFIESYNKNFLSRGNIKIDNLENLKLNEKNKDLIETKNKHNISEITSINFSEFKTQISKNYMRIPIFAFSMKSNMNLLVFKNMLNKGMYIRGTFNLDLIEDNKLIDYEITFDVKRIVNEQEFYNTPFLKIILLSITFTAIFNSIFLLSYIEKTPSNSRYVSLFNFY